MDFKVAGQILLEFKKIMDQLKIKFWLSDGIVLGIIRNNDFLSGDDDIDLRMLAVDWTPSILKNLKNNGFHTKAIYRHKGKIAVITTLKQGIKTDIGMGYYYPPKDLSVFLTYKPSDHATVQPAKFYRGEHFIDFLGTKFRVPYPTDEYLEKLYNKDWRIPVSRNIWHKTLKPMSISKYVKYFQEHPEINK